MEAVRIDATCIGQFKGRTVKIIGKLIQNNGSSIVIDANGQIPLSFVSQSPLTEGHFYEFVATVGPDDAVKVIEETDMGEDLNERALNKVVELSHKFPELFYTA